MMNRITTYLLIILPAALSFNCNLGNSITTNCYCQITVDQKYAIIGTYPVEGTKAADINHYRFSYDKKNRLQKIEYFRKGTLHKDKYFNTAIISFEYGNNYELRYYKDENENIAENKYGFYSEKIIYKKNMLEIIKYDNHQNIVEDSLGVSIYFNELNDDGLIKSYANHDASGNPILDKNGVYEIKYKYDPEVYAEDAIEMSFHDLHGNLIESRDDGVAAAKFSYDKFGNITKILSFNKSGEPLNSGEAIVRMKYDSGGNMIQINSSNSKDQLNIIFKFDEDGNIVEQYFFGDNGELQANQEWGDCAIIQNVFDKSGRLIERRCYGPDSCLTISSDWDCPIVQIFYDDNGVAIGKKEVHINEKLKIDPK